jgi:hypothetical protein
LCDEHVGSGDSGEEEEGRKYVLEPVISIAKAHRANEIVNLLALEFYIYILAHLVCKM